MEGRSIPEWIDYDHIPGLRTESRLKLIEIQPATIGLASRISGINPTDVSLLMVWIKRGQKETNELAETQGPHNSCCGDL